MSALLWAWLVGGLLPLLVAKEISRRLPDTAAVNIGVLAAMPVLLVGALVLEIALGYW